MCRKLQKAHAHHSVQAVSSAGTAVPQAGNCLTFQLWPSSETVCSAQPGRRSWRSQNRQEGLQGSVALVTDAISLSWAEVIQSLCTMRLCQPP